MAFYSAGQNGNFTLQQILLMIAQRLDALEKENARLSKELNEQTVTFSVEIQELKTVIEKLKKDLKKK